MSYTLKNILNFLKEEGWQLLYEGINRNRYQPPVLLDLSPNYYLSLPKSDKEVGFQLFVEKVLLDTLEQKYEGIYSFEELKALCKGQQILDKV